LSVKSPEFQILDLGTGGSKNLMMSKKVSGMDSFAIVTDVLHVVKIKSIFKKSSFAQQVTL
jgi:hypothetical protein